MANPHETKVQIETLVQFRCPLCQNLLSEVADLRGMIRQRCGKCSNGRQDVFVLLQIYRKPERGEEVKKPGE